MLAGNAREAAIRCCDQEAIWKPVHARGILAIALEDEGWSGGVEVPSYKQRHQYQALVVAQKECRYVREDDLVIFDIGRGEELRTVCGEVFFYITESNLAGYDETFWDSKPQPRQLASGLFLP